MTLFSSDPKEKTDNVQTEEIKILATNLEVINKMLSNIGPQAEDKDKAFLNQKLQKLQQRIMSVEQTYKDENLKIYQKLKESTNLLQKVLNSDKKPSKIEIKDDPEVLKKQNELERKIHHINTELSNMDETLKRQQELIKKLLDEQEKSKLREKMHRKQHALPKVEEDPKLPSPEDQERFFMKKDDGKIYSFE